jgi:hypothetical protein
VDSDCCSLEYCNAGTCAAQLATKAPCTANDNCISGVCDIGNPANVTCAGGADTCCCLQLSYSYNPICTVGAACCSGYCRVDAGTPFECCYTTGQRSDIASQCCSGKHHANTLLCY